MPLFYLLAMGQKIREERPLSVRGTLRGVKPSGLTQGDSRGPWRRTNEPAVIHRSSFGEDKEGTLGSFVMSSDVEVYLRWSNNK